MSLKKNWISLACLVVGFGIALAPFMLPVPRGINTSAELFSAGRAMQHVQVIAQKPHPIGSAEMLTVRAYLVEKLQAIGLKPEIQHTVTTSPYHSAPIMVDNILARIPGSGDGQAILIVTHYDSVAYGPGAGDNGSGTAVLLETARALKFVPALHNDILLLFEDGEEIGYLGGFAFSRQHPWVQSVRIVIGLDTAARGPVMILSADPGNGRLIEQISAAYRFPVANSFWLAAVNDVGGDDNETTPYKDLGIPGIAIEDPYAFGEKHSAADTVEKVNPASVQHMGDQTLALIRLLGNANLSQEQKPDVVFFTFWPFGVIDYPLSWSLPLVILASLVLILGVVLCVNRLPSNWGSLGNGFVSALGTLLAAAFIGFIGSWLINQAYPVPNPYIEFFIPPAGWLYFGLFLGLVVLLCWFAFSHKRQPKSQTGFFYGTLSIWIGLMWVTTILMPKMAYMFTWPALFGLCACLAAWKSAARWVRLIFHGVTVLAALVLFIPPIASRLSRQRLQPVAAFARAGEPDLRNNNSKPSVESGRAGLGFNQNFQQDAVNNLFGCCIDQVSQGDKMSIPFSFFFSSPRL